MSLLGVIWKKGHFSGHKHGVPFITHFYVQPQAPPPSPRGVKTFRTAPVSSALPVPAACSAISACSTHTHPSHTPSMNPFHVFTPDLECVSVCGGVMKGVSVYRCVKKQEMRFTAGSGMCVCVLVYVCIEQGPMQSCPL